MSVWKSSWRHSLAAMVVTAFWGSASQAPAQEIPKPPEHKPAAVHNEGQEVRHETVRQEVHVIEAKPGGQPHAITVQTQPGGLERLAVVVQATAQLDPRARGEIERTGPEAGDGDALDPRARGEIQQRRRQLEEKLRALEAQLKAFKPDQDAQAREVKQAIDATRRVLEVTAHQIAEGSAIVARERPGVMGPEVRELMMKRVQLEQKARDIEGKLKEHPDSPEARELREALEKTHREIAELTERLPEQMRGMKITFGEKGRVMVFGGAGGGGMAVGVGGPPLPPEERQRLERRLDELEAKIRELKQAGKNEEAEQLRREGEEIKRRLVGPPAGMMGPGGGMGMGGFGGGGFGVRGPMMPQLDPPERERRMKHLKIAVENLREAGMPELADRLAQQGEAMLQGRLMPGMRFDPTMPGMAPQLGGPMTPGMAPHPTGPMMPGMAPQPGQPMMPGMAPHLAGPMMPGKMGPMPASPVPGPGGPPGVPGMGPPQPPQPPGPPEAMLRELSEQIRALQRQIDELRQQVRPRENPRTEPPKPREQARPRQERLPELPPPRDQPKPREEPRR
jgi:hypothetical protein